MQRSSILYRAQVTTLQILITPTSRRRYLQYIYA